jgi:nucleoside-diphosphate-sugar epimerase
MSVELSTRLALVTGASGFTGGHLARALLARGWGVRALVRSARAAEDLRGQGMAVVQGDLVDARAVDQAVAGCSHVFHIAALYREAKHPDQVYRKVNVDGTRHVLAAAARHGVQRLVHCSTAGVHGEVARLPADESAPFNQGDIYQETKLEGELLAQRAFADGLPGVVFRPVGIYGPGDLRFLKLFRTIQQGRFVMFGRGEVSYHMTYIDDLVSGIMLCAEHPQALGEVFLLAGERYTSINELVVAVARAVGVEPPRRRLPLAPLLGAAWTCETLCRPFGIEPPLHLRRCDFFHKARGFSIEKAKRRLGYQPKIELDEGFRRTAQWYVEHGHLRPA